MSSSIWNSDKPRRGNPALSPGHVVIEQRGDTRNRLFAHKLGSVDFSARRNLNSERDAVIEREIGNLTTNGFRYKHIGHVYSEERVTQRTGQSYSYPIYSHGHPLGGTERAGMESCSRYGLQCENGQGSNALCNPGRCVIGNLERVSESKWKYTSANTYGSPARPVIYYLPADESVVLKTILRGNYTTYASNGDPYSISVNLPASTLTTILLPPKFYYLEDFTDSNLIRRDERLDNVARKPSVNTIGVEDRKARFVRNIAIAAYPGASEGYIDNRLHVPATEEIRDALLEFFSGAREEWKNRCGAIIEEEFLYRFTRVYDGLDLISVVFDRIKVLFESIIQTVPSSFSGPSISFAREGMARPVYSRLPGISEAYNSVEETPAKWLTSGTDEFLSAKKDSIASFYLDYLDPDLCNPDMLDWLAQHVGLFGDLWNPLWSSDIKRTFIRNMFGWWDREVRKSLPGIGDVLTPKGVNLQQFPFTSECWVENNETTFWNQEGLGWENITSWSGESDNLLKIKLDEIERLSIASDGTLHGDGIFKMKSYSGTTTKVSLVPTDQARANKVLWNGMVEAKGSLMGVVFLTSMFGLKAHTSDELEIVDAERGILKPKNGARVAEKTAPVLLPYKQEPVQVGTLTDGEVGNYTNQLVAGVSRVTDIESSKNVFFRMPYYYNRDGKSWDRVSYIAKNWMPSNLNVRVQYAHFAADLSVVGDAFFDPFEAEEV